MIDKLLSIIIGLSLGVLIFNSLKQKNKIILNYKFNLNKNDKIRINSKCSKSL